MNHPNHRAVRPVVSRPRSRRRALATVVIATVLSGVFAAGAVSIAWLALGNPRPAAGAVWLQVTRLGGATYTGAPEEPFFALVIGTGARSDDPAETHDDPGLADAVHVIGVNPSLNAATILDIPRDTEGPGGRKINSYIVDNPERDLRTMADAVSGITGAPITYVIRANFPNFVQMVDEMGGIDIEIPAPMHDSFSGTDFEPGPAHLNGDQALAFARDRHSFSNGDVSRTQNQGLLVIAALQTLRNRNPGAGETVRLVAVAGRHTKLDGVGIAELFRLGRYALSIDPVNVKNVVLPVANSGSGSNLAKTAAAASLLGDFVDDGVLQSH